MAEIPDYLQMMIFGRPGIGKTHFIGTGIRDSRVSPMLILDVDGGVMSIRSKVARHPIVDVLKGDVKDSIREGKGIAVRVTTWKEVEEIAGLLADPKDPNNIYNSVVVDSFTELNYINLQAVVKKEKGANPSRGISLDKPELDHYGISANQIRRMVRVFRDFPLHTFFTAHEETEKDELLGTIETKPSFVGKLSIEVPALLGVVGYMSVKPTGGTRVMRFQPTGRIHAKDRSEGGRLGETLENPTLPRILDLILGPVKE